MIIFDLDGTLADCEHRRHFVDPKKRLPPTNEEMFNYIKALYSRDLITQWKPDWKSFYEACDKDRAIFPTWISFNNFSACREDIEIWSGRCESQRQKTINWLKRFTTEFDSNKLKMRPIGDHTPDDELKERWLDEALSEGKNIDLVFDDRPKVVRMWQRRGIFVFNCCQHDEEF